MPEREDWKRLAVDGLQAEIENPVKLSLEDLRALGDQETISMHHCIQGWSGIADWRGIPMGAGVTVIAFYSFGSALFGGAYYETQDLYNIMKPECLLALKMNG